MAALAELLGPFQADDDWMARQLGVHPRAVIRKLAMMRCQTGPNFELFEYEIAGQIRAQPANSDVGGHHLAFYVDDIAAAVAWAAPGLRSPATCAVTSSAASRESMVRPYLRAR